MKKSKIIIPALAVLTLSTAAAVSGTVAWFTATRTASINVTSTVINPEGDLVAQAIQGTGTSVDNTGKTVTMASNVALRDASLNVANGAFTAYAAQFGADGALSGYRTVTATDTTTVGTNTVRYFAEFTIKFSVPSANESEKFDIFFDAAVANSKCTTTNKGDVQNAYRVAMYSGDASASKLCVWAPAYNTDTSAGTVAHVTGTATTNKANYTTAYGTISTASKTTAQADNKFLGTVNGGADNNITINVVMWYDGEDTNCVLAKLASGITDTASYSMAFQAINQNDYLA